MEFKIFLITAILVEAICENLKMVWDKGKFNLNMLIALLVGIGVCILGDIDLFGAVGINISIKIVACALTGIIVSRGANVVNDLISRFNGKKYLEDTVLFNDLSEQQNETKGSE